MQCLVTGTMTGAHITEGMEIFLFKTTSSPALWPTTFLFYGTLFQVLQFEFTTLLHPLPTERMYAVMSVLPTYLNNLVLIYKENSTIMKFNINTENYVGMAQLVCDMATG